MVPTIFTSIVLYKSASQGVTPTIPAKWKTMSDLEIVSDIDS